MTRYVEAFSWTGTIQRFLETAVTEHPHLHPAPQKRDADA